ncbi:MAG: HDIG domain-containing metalloprotein [Verrucomicrobiota bacterium]
MIKWLERKRLVRKGLACDKTRRDVHPDSWRDYLDRSVLVRLLLLAVMLLALLGISLWQEMDGHPGRVHIHLLTFLIFLSGVMYVQMDLPEVWQRNSKLLLLLGSVWANLVLTKALFLWSATNELIQHEQLYFLAPSAFAPLMASLLLGHRAGLYAVITYSLLSSFLLMEFNFNLLTVSLITGFTAVYFSRGSRKRSHLIKAGVAVGIASFLCAIAYGLVDMGNHNPYSLAQQALIGIFVGIGTALLVSAILPIIESLFGIITDISWIEMADLNHPLLQQMTIEAPGTYHHSLVVANLAEGAATAIGLNPTKLRVMAYFHDIGKIIKPEYFTENIPPGENPHANLSPTMSALIIIAHVKEGVDLALKFGLRKPIVDAIKQHHGDSLVYYFYRRAKQLEQDAKEGGRLVNMREEDIPEVSESSFRYPGPNPQNKEIGILSLADTIEAASRSLEKPTPARIEAFVRDLISQRIKEGILDESQLTLNEIRTASRSFQFTLKSMMHNRISYPTRESADEQSKAGEPAKKEPTPAPAPPEAA